MDFTLYALFVQSVALLAVAVFALSFHANTRARILFINAVSLLLWTLHFSLLHAWTGVAVMVVNLAISVLLLLRDKRPHLGNNVFLGLCFAALAAATYLSWEGFYSIFAFLAVSSITLAKWQDQPQNLRFVAIWASVFWIVYDYFAGSSGGIVAECVILASLAVSIARGNREVRDGA